MINCNENKMIMKKRSYEQDINRSRCKKEINIENIAYYDKVIPLSNKLPLSNI